MIIELPLDIRHAGHGAVDIRVSSKHHESCVGASRGILDAILTPNAEWRIEIRRRACNSEASYVEDDLKYRSEEYNGNHLPAKYQHVE